MNMGYIQHHTIVVTTWDSNRTSEVRSKAADIFGDDFVSEYIISKINGYTSFFIPPDGSKEGWGSSEDGDTNRQEFVNWCRDKSIDFVEVSFGGDDPQQAHIVSHNS